MIYIFRYILHLTSTSQEVRHVKLQTVIHQDPAKCVYSKAANHQRLSGTYHAQVYRTTTSVSQVLIYMFTANTNCL